MDAVLIRYGELFLKSEPVRRHFINILIGNLKNALDSHDVRYDISVFRGRILVTGDEIEHIARVAARLFGVVGVSICVWTAPERDIIEDTAVEMALKHLKSGTSFAVRTRRSGMEGFTSQELGASIGAKILERMPDLSVDLKHPSYELHVEARDIGGIIYEDVMNGPGGLPLGTQGRSLAFLSAGIDSPVASWLMMRRGSIPCFVHFAGGSWMGEDVSNTVCEHMRVLSTWCPGTGLSLIVVDIEPFYDVLVKSARMKNRCIICKRFMFRIGSEIARKHGMLAIVTGENIGQVASQTLINMGVIGEAVPPHLPVIRPLITYDKQETVDLARLIGTFRDSAGDLGCRAVPKHPAISASLEAVMEDEERMDIMRLSGEVLTSVRTYRALNGKIQENY